MKKQLQIINTKNKKIVKSEDYNYIFDKKTGFFARWGKTEADDPLYAPGPEIADVEITSSCSYGCSYCYKSNTANGKNMSLETFKNLINKINKFKILTQVAFGLGATGEENPELWDMCSWLRSEGIVPNGTVANISDSTADKIANMFGACAVSAHSNKNHCYDSIKKLTDRGLTQTNMHFVIHSDNYKELLSTIQDIKKDPRLEKLNAIVLLSLKQKGRATINSFKPLSQEKFSEICEILTVSGINFGFDSCSSHKYMNFVKNTKSLTKKQKEEQLTYIEPCESFSIFSSYANVDAEYFPCSFAEGLVEPFDVLNCTDFIDEVWNSERMKELRAKSLSCKRDCILYKI